MHEYPLRKASRLAAFSIMFQGVEKTQNSEMKMVARKTLMYLGANLSYVSHNQTHWDNMTYPDTSFENG